MKPLNVMLIEKTRRITLFKRLPPVLICLLLALGMEIAQIPALITYIMAGANVTETLVNLALGITFLFVGLFGTFVLFRIAEENLPKILEFLSGAETIAPWAEQFSRRSQIRVIAVSAVALGIFNTFLTVLLNKFDPLSLVSSALHGLFLGPILANLVHFYFKFSSIGPALFSRSIKMHALYPAETVTVRLLVGTTLQFMFIMGCIFTTMFAMYVLRIAVATAGFNVGVGVVTLFLVGAWGTMLVPFVKTLDASGKVVRYEKDKTLAHLQSLIDQVYQKLPPENLHQSLAELDDLLKLYNSVKASSEIPINLASLGRLIAGFLLPLLPILLNRWIGG